jgi:hypothetical protein
MPELDRRLREVSQLRKIWRAFRDPQERLEDEGLSQAVVQDVSHIALPPEPVASYGMAAVRAAIRYWWCRKQHEAIVSLGDRLDSSAFDSEPLLRVYLENARSSLTESRSGTRS